MKKISLILAIMCSVLFLASACGAEKTETDATSQTYFADLDHDGTDERIKIYRDTYQYIAEVYDREELLWSEFAADAHPGWKALFLCQNEDGDYLLRYSPTMYQGVCTYGYQLFTLEDGQEQIADQDQVEFDINFGSPLHDQFEPAAIASLVETVNTYLAESKALLVTDPNLLNTFEKNGMLKDDLWFLDTEENGFIRDSSASLEENLIAYAACQSDSTNPTLPQQG